MSVPVEGGWEAISGAALSTYGPGEEDLEPNSTHADNFQKRWRWGVYWTPGCGLVVYVSRSKSSQAREEVSRYVI